MFSTVGTLTGTIGAGYLIILVQVWLWDMAFAFIGDKSYKATKHWRYMALPLYVTQAIIGNDVSDKGKLDDAWIAWVVGTIVLALFWWIVLPCVAYIIGLWIARELDRSYKEARDFQWPWTGKKLSNITSKF